MKYTYEDVIIDPEDPRVEIGKEYYLNDIPSVLLREAREGVGSRILKDVQKDQDSPFVSFLGYSYNCLIRKKEPEKRYVPFDLSNEEDRAKLRGAWIKVKYGNYREYQIISLSSEIIYCGHTRDLGFSPISLLEAFEFVDGTPCGKLVKEEE